MPPQSMKVNRRAFCCPILAVTIEVSVLYRDLCGFSITRYTVHNHTAAVTKPQLTATRSAICTNPYNKNTCKN